VALGYCFGYGPTRKLMFLLGATSRNNGKHCNLTFDQMHFLHLHEGIGSRSRQHCNSGMNSSHPWDGQIPPANMDAGRASRNTGN